MSRLPLLAALLLLATACAGPDLRRFGADCRVDRQAELPLTVVRNFLLAPVSLEGRRVMMVVDTGAESTVLTPQTVALLGLESDPGRRSVLLGVGGLVRSQNVTVHRLEIGGLARTEQSVVVSTLGLVGDASLPIAGLLGTDILSRHDVEIDVPGRRMRLYAVTGCTGFMPWDDAGTAVPVRISRQGLVFLPLAIDDHPVRALLDTGARNSLMTRRLAAALGVTGAMLGADPAHDGVGVGAASIALRQHRFARVALGPLIVRDMPINVADLRLPGVDMLLGADWLASRHAWIAYSSGALFIRR